VTGCIAASGTTAAACGIYIVAEEIGSADTCD